MVYYTYMNEPTPHTNESIKGIEQLVTKESVINSLRENPENLAVLHAYIDARQKQIQAPYVSREDTESKSFSFSIELAEIYRDAGLHDIAADAYNDAADFAQANGMEEEYALILAELAKI